MSTPKRHLDRIFISYSHVDNNFVNALAQILDDLEVPYFRDTKSIDWGADIDASVSDALASSSHLLVVISPASESSTWVPYELGQGRALGLVILPLLTHPSLKLPSYLSGNRHLSSIPEFRIEIESMSRRAVPINVSLEFGHTQPATFEKQEGGPTHWGVEHFETGENVDTGAWLPSVTISGASEASYPIRIASGYFSFSPRIQLVDNSYSELAMQPSEEGRWLSPGGTARMFFSPGPVTNAIARAIRNGGVQSFGVETDDGLRVEGSEQELSKAADYFENFFGEVDLDQVWQNIQDRYF